MKVCLISYEYPPSGGGEGSYTATLARGLSEAGHRLLLVVPEMSRNYEVTGENIETRTVRTARHPFGVASFVRGVNRRLPTLLNEFGIDVVHITFDYPTYPFDLGSFKRPVVATVHHLHTSEERSRRKVEGGPLGFSAGSLRSSFITRFERSLLGKASSVIAISKFTAEETVSELGVDASKVRVIYHGIAALPFEGGRDISSFRRLADVGNEKIVLYVGRLEESKGIEHLVHAFSAARPRIDNARLVIIGSGSRAYLSLLKNSVHDLSIENQVSFLGRVDNETLLDAYAAATVVVLPSFMEGLGLTLLESMAAGKPCIASAVGGVPEVISDGSNGLLVPPGDRVLLASAIVKVLSDDGLAASLGSAGRRLVTSDFTSWGMVKKTVEVYEEALKGPRSSAR